MPARGGGQVLPLYTKAGDFSLHAPPIPQSSRWRPPPNYSLATGRKKKDKSPKEGCLTGQRLLEMGAELFFPGSERGRREGGAEHKAGGAGAASSTGQDACAASTSPLCLQKEVTGGIRGDAGGDAGVDAGLRQPLVRKTADPFSQSQASDLIPRNGANTAQLRASGG